MEYREFTFRTPNGRFTHAFNPTTSLKVVREVVGRSLSISVAELLVGFPPRPVRGSSLEDLSPNEVITIAEGPDIEIVKVKEEPTEESRQVRDRPVRVLEAKRLIAAEINQQKIAQKVICRVILGVSQGRLCQLMQDTAYDNTIISKPYPNKSLEHYHKIYEFLTQRSPIERYNLYCSAAWRIEKERLQKKEALTCATMAATSSSSVVEPLQVTPPRLRIGTRGKRTYIPNFAKKAMENYFINTSRFITQETREFFARQLNLPEETVQFYFKNLRAREKKGSFVPVS